MYTSQHTKAEKTGGAGVRGSPLCIALHACQRVCHTCIACRRNCNCHRNSVYSESKRCFRTEPCTPELLNAAIQTKPESCALSTNELTSPTHGSNPSLQSPPRFKIGARQLSNTATCLSPNALPSHVTKPHRLKVERPTANAKDSLNALPRHQPLFQATGNHPSRAGRRMPFMSPMRHPCHPCHPMSSMCDPICQPICHPICHQDAV